MVNRNCDVNLTNEERGKVVQIESMGKEVRERKKRYCEKDLLLKEVLEFFVIIRGTTAFTLLGQGVTFLN